MTLNVLHLTDTHVCATSPKELFGVNTDTSLRDVINDVKQRQLPVDLTLITGDLSHDEGETSYRKLHSMLQPLNSPLFYLPGNHDDPQVLAATLENTTQDGIFSFNHGQWCFVLLDTHKPGAIEGRLSKTTLAALGNTLIANGDKPTLIATHHPACSIGSQWLDNWNLENGAELLSLVQGHPQVKLIINGHIHQVFQGRHCHIDLLGSPSTCVQFKPATETPQTDTLPPGYRHLQLNLDGSYRTQVYFLD